VAVILLGAAAVLVFDTIGSLASRHFGFAYSRLMAGSFAIYSAAGFAANAGGWLRALSSATVPARNGAAVLLLLRAS
jgi:hypothetical protein